MDVQQLRRVLPENQAAFRELFLAEDSDDEYFEGFDDVGDGDVDRGGRNADGDDDRLGEIFWRLGNLHPRPPIFTGEQKVNIDMPADSSCLDFLNLFLTEEFYQLLTTETNRYAHQFFDTDRGKDLGPHSRFHNFQPITLNEMKQFIALIIAMGLLQQQDIQDYWSTDVLLQTPIFRSVMPRNRFLVIMSFLHLNDNTTVVPKGQDGYDKLNKIRPIFDMLRASFPAIYSPGQNLSLDEGMIAWRGNLGFRTYMPNKPIKYGIKTYEVCDALNGYCCQFDIYCGATTDDVSPKGILYDLVMRLMDLYLDKGHNLYVDNYYTSPVLFQDLFDRSTGACGTLRANRRGVPTRLKEKQLAKGESMAMTNGTLQLLKWHDRKVVYLCSTLHNAEFVDSTRHDPNTGEVIRRPHCVMDYDRFMGAVDRSDQMLTYSGFQRRSVKWWKKAFFHMVMLAVLNAHILYKFHCQRQQKPVVLQRVFRRTVVKELLESSCEVPVVADPELPGAEVLMRLSARHFPKKVKPKPGAKKLNPARLCVVCSTSTGKRKTVGDGRRRKETTCECRKCNVGLCWTPCFEFFHRYKDYKAAWRRWNAGVLQAQPSSDSESDFEPE